MNRKIILIIAAFVICLGLLTACNNNPATAEPTPTPVPIQTVQPTPSPTATMAPQPTPLIVEPTAVPTPVPTPTPSSTDSGDGTDENSDDSSTLLKIESEGDRVTEIQELLNDLGYLDSVTGYFGTDTESAVKAFQRNNGLTEDGIVGSGTLKVLRSDDAKSAN